MARGVATPRGRWQRNVLDDLIQERGLRRGDYVLFLVSGEGILWPAGRPDLEDFEEVSGHVLTREGKVFAFWLGWDEERRMPCLTEWEEVQPEPHWRNVGEYRRAREAVGLPEA